MEHVNGDMEDLFRRAAEKYPLRTDGADWDRLAAALDKGPGSPSDADTEDKRRRRGIFWWLLLPLAGALGFYIWHSTIHSPAQLSKTNIPADVTAPAGKGAGAEQATAGQPAGAQTATTESAEIDRTGAQTATTESAGIDRTGTQATKAQPAGVGATGAQQAGAQTKATELNATQPAGTSAADRQSPGARGQSGRRGTAADAGGTDGRNVTGADRFDAADKNIGSKNTGSKGGSGNGVAGNATSATGHVAASWIDLRRVPTAGSYSVVVDVKAPAARKDSSAKPAKKATAKSNKGHGYIGLTGAPDLSTVKMQSVKGAGTTWGLILGYAFNSHWAVETGVSLDRKKYYTAGEYYKGETNLPYNSTLLTVDGTCNMWEVPLNVRYNFNPGSKINWFATAGMSSYFMTKQQYTYEAKESGGAPWPGSWYTSAPANYLFSVINLSGGFEQRIGKIGNLRIEPYVRLPLSGIGTGRLPIMSAGLNIGITRQLW